MPLFESQWNGFIEIENQTIPVIVSLASKYALWIHFPENVSISDGDIFLNFWLQPPAPTAKLGRCRFIDQSDTLDKQGWLIFLDMIYDCEALLSMQKVFSI